MEFTYTITAELNSLERMTLALKDEPFYFIRMEGRTVKINPSLPAEVVDIGLEMWSIDRLMDEEDSNPMDALYARLQKVCGETGADQLYHEWSRDLQSKLAAENRAEANAWLEEYDVSDELDAICDRRGTYKPGFIEALWNLTRDTNAIFLYGYQVGMEAAKKAVLA